MGRRFTFLEDLCRHAVLCGAETIEIEYKDRKLWVYGRIGNGSVSFASFPSAGKDAAELVGDLERVHKRHMRTVLDGRPFTLEVQLRESFGEPAWDVAIIPAARPDPARAPKFTNLQGQYLAYIYNYTKMHGRAPAEADLQRYFGVAPPSVHEMLKTLERNVLIERTPGQARSIRLLVQPEHLPILK